MKKVIVVFLILALMGCKSIAFDPAGKLAKKVPSTATATMLVLPVKHLVAASPTAALRCQVTGDLHLRAAPNAGSPVVDYLLTGEMVTATGGENAGWRAVRNWAGASGFVNVKWLECGK